MFVYKPIILFLLLLSGFSDILIFVFTQLFLLVWKQWGFSMLATGMTFRAIIIDYFLAYFIYLLDIWQQQQICHTHRNVV